MEDVMRDRKRLLPGLLGILLSLALLLGSCQVLPTVEPTAAPTLPPPSPIAPTAEPTAAPTVPPPTAPPACTDQATFDSDITIPPDTPMLPGQAFVKTWRLRNSGSCPWSMDYALIFANGDRMGGATAIPLPANVGPGQTVDLSVALVAPAGTGTYEGRWLLRNASGGLFGITQSVDGTFAVRIAVGTTPLPPTTAPVTPSPTAAATVLPTAGPTPVITDWRGEYFANPNLAGNPALVRNDVAIDFDWQENAPAPELPNEEFSVRWTRSLAFESGVYRFRAVVDDGIRLWLDDKLVIDDWRDAGRRELLVDQTVLAGSHTVRVEYYDRAIMAVIQVEWDKQPSLYPDWKGEYWSNPSLSGTPVLVQNEGALDFNWRDGSIAGGMPSDNFSARWTRISAFEAATYRFTLSMDDGARMWVDDRLIIDSWRDGAFHEETADVALTRGDHILRVEYYERGGEAQVHLRWEKALVTPTPSPTP
jgi:hypothetical protein